MKNLRLITIIYILFLTNCRQAENKNIKLSLSKSDKILLESFTQDFIKSINKYDYKIIRKSWDKKTFRERVDYSNRKVKSVLVYKFDKYFTQYIIKDNFDIIDALKRNKGKAYFSNINYNQNHADIILTFHLYKFVTFIKYRIEIISNKVKITDSYSFSDEIWDSDKINNYVMQNSEYKSITKNISDGDQIMKISDIFLQSGDSVTAFFFQLFFLPKDYLKGNYLNSKKVEFIHMLRDSSILNKQFMFKNFVDSCRYTNYLHSFLIMDTLNVKKNIEDLYTEVNIKKDLKDSLINLDYIWK